MQTPVPDSIKGYSMERKLALTVLTFVLALNIGSVFTAKIDPGISKIESSIYDKIEDRTGIDRYNETELRTRSRTKSLYANGSHR